jgi:hypothetical protein
MEGGAVGFLEELGDLIDRPCRRNGCGKFVPESSPSDDFCSESCETAWRAENNGCKYVDSWLGEGYVVVPEGHPAEPTHRSSTDLAVPEPAVGIGQVLSSAFVADLRQRHGGYENLRTGRWDGGYRDWMRYVAQYATPEAFSESAEARGLADLSSFRIQQRAELRPGQVFLLGDGGEWRAHGIVTGVQMGMDGETRTFLSVDPAAEPEWQQRERENYGAHLEAMRRQIAAAFDVPYDLVGAAPRPGNLLWMFDETSLLYPQRTIRREWMDQFRDDADWLLDVCDAVIEFFVYDLPDAVRAGAKRAWRFVTRS